VDVVGLGSGMAGFAATGGVACAWTAAGAASCWGYDECGMLGDGQGGDCDNATDPWVYSPVPSPVVSIPGGVADIALGGTACAVSADGGAWCWGWNPAGQLGLDCAEPFSAVPVPIAGLESGVADVAVGNEHVCALTDAGGVKCWGSNQRGQLGDGQAPTCYDPENPTPPSAVPVDVSGLQSGVVAIDAGFNHTCALTVDGAVLCWGENEMGQIGNGDDSWCNDLFPDQHDVPVPDAVVELDAPIVSLSCGWWHSCAVDDQGGILCWGMGGFGQLGNLHTTYHWSPVRVVGYGGY
jgi:alpha-tubulin suppressor-like RCC1 family protein